MAAQRPAQRPTGGGGRRRRLLVVVAAVGVLGLTATTVAVLRPDGAGPAETLSRGPLAEVPGGDPGLIHVHGLGVDPADGTLYAATHSGLFRVPAHGPATRVANRYQDTMGFTVTPTGEFLGSGHPDLREDLPPLLGLISSTDAGVTWRSESLLGGADFHTLRTATGVVYGYDSTGRRLMATTDRRTWQTRSALPLRDFAVDPADPDHLVATGEQGVLDSTDGGRTWSALTAAPAVRTLAWGPSGLYGITAGGEVYTSTDTGTAWERRGNVGGPPEAATLHDSAPGAGLYVAVTDHGIVHSTDGGRSFVTRYATAGTAPEHG